MYHKPMQVSYSSFVLNHLCPKLSGRMHYVKSQCHRLGTVFSLWLWLQKSLSLQPALSAHLAVGHQGWNRNLDIYTSSVVCSVQPLPKGDQVLNFSDAEDLIDDSKLK